MANPPPLWPTSTDSQTDLLRKILTNIAFSIENGGGGGGSLPSQGGHAGEFLTTDGATASWAAIPAGGASNAYAAATNNSGNTTLTPTQSNQTSRLTFTGAAGNRIIILDVAGRTAGDRILIDLIFPATSGLVVSVRNATSGGTLLLPVEMFPTQDFTTDGNVLSGRWEFTYTGTAWIYDMSNLPA